MAQDSLAYALDALQAIMLVESADGSKVLLGRAKTIRHNSMLTCLSGFVEQVETIEEACRREVHEESGIDVGPVHIAGSQPWPMGKRHCHCVLCMSLAKRYAINC